MRLSEVALAPEDAALSAALRTYLDDAEQSIETFGIRFPSFIPCDHEAIHAALLEVRPKLTGRRFLEWGAGLGVVAGLAAALGYDAHAIEIEDELVDAGCALHERHGLTVDFASGTFIPEESQDLVAGTGSELDWLRAGGDDGYEQLARDPDEFDLVFVYPWPGEEGTVVDLFARHAGEGAILLSWHGIEGLRARRAVS